MKPEMVKSTEILFKHQQQLQTCYSTSNSEVVEVMAHMRWPNEVSRQYRKDSAIFNL